MSDPANGAHGGVRVGAGRTLQDFEVLYVCIFRVDVELDAGHGQVKEDAVVHLAEGGANVVDCTVSLGFWARRVSWR